MSNVEGRYSVYFIKKTERSETILRNSVRRRRIILLFCGSLFRSAEVSYEVEEYANDDR